VTKDAPVTSDAAPRVDNRGDDGVGVPSRRRRPGRPESLSTILLVIAMIGAIIGVVLGGELHFFSTPAEPTIVEVVARQGAQQGEGSPSYTYTVLLPDGRTVAYKSLRVWRVGDRFAVSCSRGRLTDRVLLSGPELPIAGGATGR
jgi:hypothetical protein